MWAGGSQLVLCTQELSGSLILACWGLSHGMPQENGSKASQTSRPLILHSRSSNMVWVPDRGRSLLALSVSAYQPEYQRWVMHIPSNPWLEPLIGRYETSNVKGGITSSFHRLSYPSRTIGTPWVSSGAWQMGAQGIQRINSKDAFQWYSLSVWSLRVPYHPYHISGIPNKFQGILHLFAKEKEPDTRADDLLRRITGSFAWKSAPRQK